MSVSSGLTSRPSLSVEAEVVAFHGQPRVVGINLPTFVERPQYATRTRWTAIVSSGLTSRPSLSGREARQGARAWAPCRRD